MVMNENVLSEKKKLAKEEAVSGSSSSFHLIIGTSKLRSRIIHKSVV